LGSTVKGGQTVPGARMPPRLDTAWTWSELVQLFGREGGVVEAYM